MKDRGGLTLMEMLLVAALIGLIVLAIFQLGAPIMKFLQRGGSRQQLQTQARICLESIDRVLSNGRASTVTISPSATTPAMPSAQIQFQSVDNSSYTITWSNTPMNSVHLLRTLPGNAVTTDTILATSVSVLGFAWSPNDPSLVNVTLVMAGLLDSSGSPDSLFTIQLPIQTIRMISS